MRVTILGTGGALPPPGRAQTGILLEKGDRCLLIDCGSGVLLRLQEAGVDFARLDDVLLTHHHLDHLSDLLPLLVARWLRDRTHTRVYGPEGTEALLRSQLELFPYAREHVSIEIQELSPGAGYEIAGFRVETLLTQHLRPTLAYRIDEAFVYSADTAPLEEMAEFARGCELLVHECSFPDGGEVPNHSTPTALGRALKGCDVKRLVLTHLYPQTQGREEEMLRAVRENFPNEVALAEDLLRFDL